MNYNILRVTPITNCPCPSNVYKYDNPVRIQTKIHNNLIIGTNVIRKQKDANFPCPVLSLCAPLLCALRNRELSLLILKPPYPILGPSHPSFLPPYNITCLLILEIIISRSSSSSSSLQLIIIKIIVKVGLPFLPPPP